MLQENQAKEATEGDTKIKEILALKEILAQKDQIIQKMSDLIKQKEQSIKQKDEKIQQINQQKEVEIQEITLTKDEINHLKIALHEVKHQQNEVSHEQEREIASKQKEVKNEETQTETVAEVIQEQSQERDIKNQRANGQKPKNIPLLPAGEMCTVDKLPEFVTSNKSMFLAVTLKSIEGHPITNGGRRICIEATNTVTKYPTFLQVNCNEKESGQYVLLFTLRDPGEYKLQICFDYRKIFDNSFRYVHICVWLL